MCQMSGTAGGRGSNLKLLSKILLDKTFSQNNSVSTASELSFLTFGTKKKTTHQPIAIYSIFLLWWHPTTLNSFPIKTYRRQWTEVTQRNSLHCILLSELESSDRRRPSYRLRVFCLNNDNSYVILAFEVIFRNLWRWRSSRTKTEETLKKK